MRLNLLILLLTMLIGAGVTIWLDNQSSTPPPSPIIATTPITSDAIPQFSVTDITGKSHHISDFKGKIVILNFWATWCPPCVIEFPKLLTLANDNPNIILLALSSDIDDQNIHKFLKKFPSVSSNVIIARDDKRHITADLFQTYKLPESLIIAPSGQMVKKIVGDTDWNGAEIKNFLKSLDP
jgi:cytochrome c biogenesis protein CcmG/thiol:disulfide interchange protein DsbE